MQLYVGPCHVASAEIAVAMAVPIDNPADWDERRNSFSAGRRDISRVELSYYTTMHVRILPGRHKPCCVSNFIGISSSIFRTVRTWHRRTCSCFQKWRSTLLVNASQMMKTWRMLLNNQAATCYEGGNTNWCQGTTSTLMSKATMWKSRQSYMPKFVYSVSILLLKNILVLFRCFCRLRLYPSCFTHLGFLALFIFPMNRELAWCINPQPGGPGDFWSRLSSSSLCQANDQLQGSSICNPRLGPTQGAISRGSWTLVF